MKKTRMTRGEVFAAYLDAAWELDRQGVKPSGRKLVAMVRGGSPQDYPNGIGNNDKLAYDNAMLALGYEKGKHTGGFWKRFPPMLDEVECFEVACPTPGVVHTLADHVSA